MSHIIRKAMFIGSGVMGAGIAAHLANAGVFVYLLDIVPAKLSRDEEKRGLTLESVSVRNRIANHGVESLKRSRKGLVTMCVGGGQGMAGIFENLS